jgi:glycosyltransferase involved in cell wall biosynthesis
MDMKVALVQDWLVTFRGGEQVLLALHTMFPEAPIYTSLYDPVRVPQFDNARIIPSYLQKLPAAHKRHELLVPLMPAAFESFDLKGYDVVISVGTGFSKGVITMPGQNHISYCHTPPRYLWKLGADTRNEGRWDSGLRAIAEHRLRIWDVVSSERPDRFLANSLTTQSRISKIYRRHSEVIYPPVNTAKYQPVAAAEIGDYALSVGQLVAYKRIDLIIEACIRRKQPLKIVGTGPEEAKLKALAAESPYIEFLGRVSDERLQEIYPRAKVFVFAAEEDFGIVPVEAMAAGRPIIAYGHGGVTESVEDGVSGVFFVEQTTDSLVAALDAFDPHAFNSRKIQAHADKYSVATFEGAIRQAVQSPLQNDANVIH